MGVALVGGLARGAHERLVFHANARMAIAINVPAIGTCTIGLMPPDVIQFLSSAICHPLQKINHHHLNQTHFI